MLEGMANHQRRALFELTGNMLLYAPACRQEDFTNAIGYLVRRLDENTGPDNFLRHAFNIEVDSPEWNTLEQQFVEAFEATESVSSAPRRTQDQSESRAAESREPRAILGPRLLDPRLSTISATNPTPIGHSRKTTNGRKSIIDDVEDRYGDTPPTCRSSSPAKRFASDRPVRESLDPSRPGTVVARYRQATEADIDRAVECCANGCRWLAAPLTGRARRRRCIASPTSSPPPAAISWARCSPRAARRSPRAIRKFPRRSTSVASMPTAREYFHNVAGHRRPSGRGVVVVVSPWNFPLAIPCGGVAAALAAGNTVILKPASDTVLIAYQLCQCFWRAGVPKTALQFAPCSGGTVGAAARRRTTASTP